MLSLLSLQSCIHTTCCNIPTTLSHALPPFYNISSHCLIINANWLAILKLTSQWLIWARVWTPCPASSSTAALQKWLFHTEGGWRDSKCEMRRFCHFKAVTKQKIPRHIQVQHERLHVNKSGSRQETQPQHCIQKLDLCMTRTAKHTFILDSNLKWDFSSSLQN